jgi:hypothetical protein
VSATNAIVSGPFGFGSGTGVFGNPTSSTGDTFGFSSGSLVFRNVFLPLSYTSGAPLSGQTTWSGETLVSLGATPGTYQWNTSYNGEDDTITLNINTAAVPEPSSLAILATFTAMLGGVSWLRRRRKQRDRISEDSSITPA